MNGVCGSLSVFSSARYLLSNDPDYLWAALGLPLAGLIFDFMDGKVARWRRESSMLGQELDSLADLVRPHRSMCTAPQLTHHGRFLSVSPPRWWPSPSACAPTSTRSF